MKTLTLSLIPLGLVYVLMFILWEPLYILAMNHQYSTSARLLSKYDKYAHFVWLERMNADSKIKEFRLRNSLYWCEKIQGCSGYSYAYGTVELEQMLAGGRRR